MLGRIFLFVYSMFSNSYWICTFTTIFIFRQSFQSNLLPKNTLNSNSQPQYPIINFFLDTIFDVFRSCESKVLVYIKTYRKWSAQIGFCTILQHFLVIFWQTTLVSFTKLRFLWTFWGAKRVLILIGSKLQDKTKSFFVSVFFNFVRKKRENFWLINGHFTTISGHFSAN